MHRKIALYIHPAHGFGPMYLLDSFVEIWRERGIETEVVDDPGRRVDADLAFLHVDMTVVPESYRALVDRYPVVINGRRTDIAKRTVSENLLTRDSGYRGPVIVKTNENCAGIQDDRARGWRFIWRPDRRNRIDRVLPRWLTGGVFSTKYHVYVSLAEVPRVVWSRDRLVVEKFQPEREGDHYCIRFWNFLGTRHISSMLRSDTHGVKTGSQGSLEHFEPAPQVLEQLFAWRRRFGLDYAKLDYVIADGRPVLFDVNPTVGRYRDLAVQRRDAARLADGIDIFFDQARNSGKA